MRGLIFTLDIILGISLLFLLLVSGYYLFTPRPLYEETGFDQKKVLSRDFLNSLAELRVSECSGSPTLGSLKNGSLSDDEMELHVIDFILTYWVLSVQEANQTKKEIAGNITNELMNSMQVLSGYNFSLIIGNDSIAGNYSSGPESVVVASLVENAYGSGLGSGYGYMARAYLNGLRAERSRYFYFGGFVGQGEISGVFDLPDYESLTGATLSVFSGSNVSLYLNGNLSGNFSINQSAQNFSANIISNSINISNFVRGNNTIRLVFSTSDYQDSYIGGGFLKIDYLTNAFYEESENGVETYFLPGVEGIINLYDGIYVSGNITDVYLHYYNEAPNAEIYMNLLNATLYASNETGEQSVLLNGSSISSAISQSGLNFSEIINSSAPVRVGTKSLNFERGEGYGDAVLITDVSGSMDTCDVSSNTTCDCDAPPPCSRDRINVAKDSDREFVSSMLNITGNRAGIVSFQTTMDTYQRISDSNASLQSQINGYLAGGSTCICCGINKSVELLSETYLQSFLVDSGGEWKYNTSYPAAEPPIISGRNWTDKDYNDTTWAAGNAVLGFFNSSWAYRKQLNLTNPGANLSNYPVRISINLSSDYAAGRVKQYCEDVRFTYYNQTSGNELEASYYIESCNLTISSNSSFWVKVPFLPNAAATRLYIYYGSPLATSLNNISLCSAGIINGKCTKFFNGFEDSAFVGKGFNTSVWVIEYGGDNDEARTQNDTGYYRTGLWAAELEEGDEGEVAISTKMGVLDLSDTKSYRLTFWTKLTSGNWEGNDLMYVDVYDGSWHYGALMINGSIYDTGAWFNFTLNLSAYNLSTNTRIRFDQEANDDSEESHWDDISVYYAASAEPSLTSVGLLESTSKDLSLNLSTDLGNNGGNYFFRKKFYLEDTSRILNSTAYILSDGSAEVYLNGLLVDNETLEHNASYWSSQVFLNSSFFRKGGNVLAVKLANNDDDSALFDMMIGANMLRKRAMLVMSDGEANYECTPNQYSMTQAPLDAIQYACNARDQNITVYSVAFGSGAGELTLKKIACWNCSANNWLSGESESNCSRFFQSNDESELRNIYRRVAEDIVNMSSERQAVYLVGGSYFKDILFNDSYIRVNQTNDIKFGEGEFMLTFEKNCASGVCTINKSPETDILNAKVTSYSGDYWVDLVKISNSSGSNRTVYNLSKYGDFENLGDIYSLSVPPSYFSNGQNNVYLFAGAQSGSPLEDSIVEKMIYSIKVPGYVGYGGENFVFNSSDEARNNATQRLVQYVKSISGEELSSYSVSTNLSIEGIRRLSDVVLVKLVVW